MLVTEVFSHRERHLQEMCQDRHSQQQQKQQQQKKPHLNQK